MWFAAGDRFYFRGYTGLEEGMHPIFLPGMMGVVVEVEPCGAMKCFPINAEGEVGPQGDTLFPDEMMRLPYPPLDLSRLVNMSEEQFWLGHFIPPYV